MITADAEAQISRQLLIDVLRSKGPQLGAKLKVLLVAEISNRLQIPQVSRHTLIPKLSDFLAANSDLVEVERPSGPGDIRVKLRSNAQASNRASATSAEEPYRVEAWIAFTNPDPNRRRFFHRQQRSIVHYSTASNAQMDAQLAERVARDPQFVEINFATAETQSSWQRDFLDSDPLISDSHRRIAQLFTQVPFDSTVNAAFLAALGPHGEGWKRFRAKKMGELASSWAQKNSIPVSQLKQSARQVPVVSDSSPSEGTQITDGGSTGKVVGNALRAALIQAAELMDESELRQVLVPLSALERILRTRP